MIKEYKCVCSVSVVPKDALYGIHVNLYIIIIVKQREGFRKVNGKSSTYHLPV